MTGRECYGQMRPKLYVLAIHTINMFGHKMECIQKVPPVVQGHYLGSMAQFIQQSTRKSCQIESDQIGCQANLVASARKLSLGHK